MSCTSDLAALARCLPVLLGRASPLNRTIAGSGQGEGSPAERVQPWLGAAMRAQRKLASMRSEHYRAVLALLGTYVYQGNGAQWPMTLSLALRNADAQHSALRSILATRAGSGPDAHSLTVEGQQLLADGERLYAEAEELPSGGEWLAGDLEALTRALGDLTAHRGRVASELAAEPMKRPKRAVAPRCVADACRVADGPRDRNSCERCRPTCASALRVDCGMRETEAEARDIERAAGEFTDALRKFQEVSR